MKNRRIELDDIIQIKHGSHQGVEHCSVTFEHHALSLAEVAEMLGRKILPGPVNYIANDERVVVAYTGLENDTWFFSDGFSSQQAQNALSAVVETVEITQVRKLA